MKVKGPSVAGGLMGNLEDLHPVVILRPVISQFCFNLIQEEMVNRRYISVVHLKIAAIVV